MADYRELANAVRALSMDGVQKAKSGHPGAPMGMADMAEALWRGFLITILRIQNSLTVIVSFCQTVMLQCLSILYFT